MKREHHVKRVCLESKSNHNTIFLTREERYTDSGDNDDDDDDDDDVDATLLTV